MPATVVSARPVGAEHVVTVFDAPYSGIARAMLGPLVLGHPLNLTENSLQCLAVTEDGEFAARILLPGNGIHHLESLCPQVAHGLDAARRTLNAVGIDSPIAAYQNQSMAFISHRLLKAVSRLPALQTGVTRAVAQYHRKGFIKGSAGQRLFAL
jgi:hypothetical protein